MGIQVRRGIQKARSGKMSENDRRDFDRQEEQKDQPEYDWKQDREDRWGENNRPEEDYGTSGHLSTGGVVLLAVVTALVLGSVIFSFFREGHDYTLPVSQLLEEGQESLEEQAEGLEDQELSRAAEVKGPLDVSDVAAAAMPCIVSITSESVQTVEYFFYGTVEIPQESVGSGIIIGQSEEELFIGTNYHVIEDADSITICFSTEAGEEETIVAGLQKGFDADMDLAVVAVKLADIPDTVLSEIRIAVLGDSDSLSVGQRVVAIGNALGYGQSVTMGIVSAVDRELVVDGIPQSFIQTDAAINKGNSGGALLNDIGEVIGINSAKISVEGAERMGYAIPIDEAKTVFAQLMDRESRDKVAETERGSLGIVTQNVSEAAQAVYQIPAGAFVYRVEAGSAGEAVGLLPGDIITEVDGITIKDADDLDKLLQYYKAGETVEMVCCSRDSGYESRTLTITLQEIAAEQSQPWDGSDPRGYGIPEGSIWGNGGGWY